MARGREADSADPLLVDRHAAIEAPDLREADALPEGLRLRVLVPHGEPDRLVPRAAEDLLERRGGLLAVAEPLAGLAEQEERDVRHAGVRVVQVEVEHPDG